MDNVNEDADMPAVKNKKEKRYYAKYLTKLSASFPKNKVADFSAACKTLNVSQASVLLPAIDEVIERARISGDETVFQENISGETRTAWEKWRTAQRGK